MKLIKSLLKKSLLMLVPLTLFSASVLAANRPQGMAVLTEQVIRHHLPNAHIGFEVRDVITGKTLLSRNAYHNFLPASNMKILTGTAALFGLGTKFAYETSVWVSDQKGGDVKNVWWKFSGDPSLTSTHLIDMAHSLRNLGVKTVNGDVVIDDSVFTGGAYGPGWVVDSMQWAYSAPITGAIINRNAVYVKIKPGARLGELATVTVLNSPIVIGATSSMVTVTQDRADNHCRIDIQESKRNELNFSGCWPISGGAVTKHVAIRNNQQWVKEIVKQTMQSRGIEIKGRIIFGKLPKKGVKRLLVHRSATLPTLVHAMMKHSDNIIAESLFKSLGKHFYGEGSYSQGALAVTHILNKWAQIDLTRSELIDGSGASRYNALTPHQLAQVMYVVAHNRNLNVIQTSLPVSAQDGTLRNRMHVFNLAKHVRAKTGSMHDVSSLTGFLTAHDGRKLAFSILMDHVTTGVQSARQVQHDLVDLFYQLG